tara:strand:+ start:398 stop:667 length:270 start_codon:yes stop_codon:yes gene_type:complete
MFRLTPAVINGLEIYCTYLARTNPKPRCYILDQIIKDETVFSDKKFCHDCDCKFSCRYSGPHSGGGTLEAFLIPLPEYNYIPPQKQQYA